MVILKQLHHGYVKGCKMKALGLLLHQARILLQTENGFIV